MSNDTQCQECIAALVHTVRVGQTFAFITHVLSVTLMAVMLIVLMVALA